MLKLIIRVSAYTLIFLLGGLVVFFTTDLFISLRQADLEPWHTIELAQDFNATMEEAYDWKRYLEREQRLFDEMYAYKRTINAAIQLESSRYAEGGNRLARRLDTDWNRSFKLDAARPKGVALVVHGLSDSPYSLRHIAQALNDNGIIVYGLRLPGHGTLPSSLDTVVWQDWLAAVRVVDRHIRQQHAGLPYYFAGYSTGAALGVKLALDAIANDERYPEQLFLLSPALGVSALARFANLHRIVSDLDTFRKARWLNVLPEYDPYKYNSFTKNASKQVSLLISQVYADIDRLQRAGDNARLPRIISFQSLVDATVSATDLVDKLYAAIDNPASELVLFDVNQISYYKELITYNPEVIIVALDSLPASDFRLTLITNQDHSTPAVKEVTWRVAASELVERPLKLAWPEDVYSLSHTSLPFPADDPVYGYDATDREGKDLLTLGNLSIRGETGVLRVPADNLLRMRSNPFYAYIEQRITKAVTTGPPDPAAAEQTP